MHSKDIEDGFREFRETHEKHIDGLDWLDMEAAYAAGHARGAARVPGLQKGIETLAKRVANQRQIIRSMHGQRKSERQAK